MKTNPWNRGLSAIAIPAFLLSGCKDEEQTRKVKELEEQVAEQDGELERVNKELSQVTQDRDKARNELDQVKREAQNAKNQAQNLQQQVDTMRKAEQHQRELADQKASQNPVEESRTAIQGKLGAIWQIVGDQKSTHGVVVECDGKTWFYFPANALGSSSKLAVKDSTGNAVTKFGEFQVAADANLARLEIKQEVPIRFPLDPKTTLGENSMLLAVTPGDDGKPQITDCSPGPITATEIELSLPGSASAGGYPIFSTENGSLISITIPAAESASGPWPQADAGTGMLRAPRLNRAIDWKSSTINGLLAERRKIEELNRITRLVMAANVLSVSSKGINLDTSVSGGNQSAKQIFDEQKSAPGVPELIKLNENLAAQKLRISETDLNRQLSGIFGQISSTSQRSVTEAKALKVSPTNRQDLENAIKWNDEAMKRFNEKISDLGRH